MLLARGREPVTVPSLPDIPDWKAFEAVRQNALPKLSSLGGPFWAARGWPDVYAGQTVTLDAHREHISFTPFTAPGRTSVLDVDPERVAIRTADGALIEERVCPPDSSPLPFDQLATRWDAMRTSRVPQSGTT